MPTTSLLEICQNVEATLICEDSDTPTYPRKPWRLISVFVYEMCWIKYFLRESEMRQRWLEMSGEEREKEDFMHRLFVVPKELGLVVRRGVHRKEVLELWRAWNEEKRRDLIAGRENGDSEGWETDGYDEEDGDEAGDGDAADLSDSFRDVTL
jgi:hypothetical protein